jgi:hypothetical protein
VEDKMRDKMRDWFLGAIALSSLLTFGCGSGDAKQVEMEAEPPPEGYSQMLVFMANAVVPMKDVLPVDGENFLRNIMHRDDAEYDRVRQDALDYFRERYGVADVDKDPRFLFGNFQFEPNSNIRAYHIADEKVPPEGWVVRDGGWQLRVIDPAGYTWEAGEFQGQFSAPGAYVLYGDYNILTDDCEDRGKNCEDPREITMRYQSRCPIPVAGPMLPDVLNFKFSCEVYSKKWGQGLGQGLSQPTVTEGGSMFQYNAREVITFSDSTGF